MKFFRRSEKYSFIAIHILSLISFFMLVMMADCADFPMTEMMDVPVTDLGRPISFVTPTTARATGGLFQKTSCHPAFEDTHVRTVGGSITIQIVDKVTADQVRKPTAIGTQSGHDFSGKGGTDSADMASSGRGAQTEAQTVGGLTRFFSSFLPF